MIDFEVKILDENDLVFVSDLRNLGVQRNVALALVYLSHIKEASSRELEIGTGLRQPEISMALGFMSDNRWIESHMVKENKKGRPLKVYSLCVKMSQIYEYYEQQIITNYNESAVEIDRLKKLVQKNQKTKKD